MTCGLSKVEARVSTFLVKICQSTRISKDGLSLEDIDFSQVNGKEVDIIIGNDVPKAHWCENNAYVNLHYYRKIDFLRSNLFMNDIAKLNYLTRPGVTKQSMGVTSNQVRRNRVSGKKIRRVQKKAKLKNR